MTAPTTETVGGISLNVDGPVWRLGFAHPERRNALSVEMRERLAVLLGEANADPACRALVLFGEGGVFSAGGDLATMTDDDTTVRQRMNGVADVVRRIVRGTTPVVAAVDGYAYGAGLSLAAACDHVVATRSATFCCSFAAVGLTADAGLHWSLPARVGAGRARSMILFGDVVTAERAEAWGLVDVLVDADSSLDEATRRAHALAARAPLSLAASKRILASPAESLDAVLAREGEEQQRLLATEDFARARAAFFAKQTPTFEGR